MEFQIKDSGKRQEYDTGMVRDIQDGKPDYTLCDMAMLKRWATHMTKGASKYGRTNWQLARTGVELERFRASALRHMMQWLAGEADEDHAAAVFFNIAAAEYVNNRIKEPNDTHTTETSSPDTGGERRALRPDLARDSHLSTVRDESGHSGADEDLTPTERYVRQIQSANAKQGPAR